MFHSQLTYNEIGQTSDTRGTEPSVHITEVSVLPSNFLNMDTTESELSVGIKEVSNSAKYGMY